MGYFFGLAARILLQEFIHDFHQGPMAEGFGKIGEIVVIIGKVFFMSLK